MFISIVTSIDKELPLDNFIYFPLLGQTGDTYDSIIAGEHEHTVLGPIIARERPA